MSASVLQVTGPIFDYSVVAPDLAEALQGQAGRIRHRIGQTTAAIVETGRDLLAVKDRLEHGRFMLWIEAEIGISIRTAQNYMRAATFAEGKSETVALLAPATVYRLAAKSTASEIIDAVMDRVRAGEFVPDSVVDRMITDDKVKKRQAKREEDQRARRRRRESGRRGHDLEQGRLQREAEGARLQALVVRAANIIADRLGDDLAELVAMLDDCGTWTLLSDLHDILQHRGGGA